jgi:hypothetical protein
MLKEGMTADWTEDEKSGRDDALQKQIETEEVNPRDVEMMTWLAVVRK